MHGIPANSAAPRLARWRSGQGLARPRLTLLTRQHLLEVPLLQLDMREITRAVDKGVRVARRPVPELLILLVQPVPEAVGTQKHVHRQLARLRKGRGVVVGDLRIIGIVDQDIVVIDPEAANDQRIVRLALLLDFEPPTGTPPSMPLRRGDQERSEELRADKIDIVDDPMGRERRVSIGLRRLRKRRR